MDNTINAVVNPEEVTTLPVSEDKKTQIKAAIADLEEQPIETPNPYGDLEGELNNPGDKTPPNQLLQALQEEREKRRQLEQELLALQEENDLLKSSTLSDPEGTPGDQSALRELQSEFKQLKTEITKWELFEKYPVLKERWDDFEAFRADPENRGMNLRTAAKAFLIENGVLEARRKGLEKPTGGPRGFSSPNMSPEEIDTLMKTDGRKFYALLKRGAIKFDG